MEFKPQIGLGKINLSLEEALHVSATTAQKGRCLNFVADKTI